MDSAHADLFREWRARAGLPRECGGRGSRGLSGEWRRGAARERHLFPPRANVANNEPRRNTPVERRRSLVRRARSARGWRRRRCADRPHRLVPSHDDADALWRLFESLGFVVEAEPHPLNLRSRSGATAATFTVTLRATKLLSELLAHVYALVPVLDPVPPTGQIQRSRFRISVPSA
ncbi:MAG TPA: hypothetical protein VFQ45_06515 [Longimicrobium sp.]|nr:hypothetical protein [Longimicrobium sp.]